MCTPQQQTIRRNYACSIDETIYMQARLAGKYLVVYKEEVGSHSHSHSKQAEEVCSRSRSGQSEEVYSRSGQFPVGSRSPGIQLEPETTNKHYFSFTKPISHNSVGIGNPVYPLITEIVRCRGSPESYGLSNLINHPRI